MTTPLLPQVHVRLAAPVSLRLRVAPHPRPRVSTDPAPLASRTFESFPLHLQIDAQSRTLRAYLPPLPGSLLLYPPPDFAAACADPMEDHAARVLQLLGNDPALALQALVDGTDIPDPPPRVPREIANWRAKVALATMGKLLSVNSFLTSLPEPDRTAVTLAWNGDAKILRQSPMVATIADFLQLSPDEIDNLFIAAAALEI